MREKTDGFYKKYKVHNYYCIDKPSLPHWVHHSIQPNFPGHSHPGSSHPSFHLPQESGRVLVSDPFIFHTRIFPEKFDRSGV